MSDTNFERLNVIARHDLATLCNDYTLRTQQKTALKWFSDKIVENKKFFILEMPTGTGKSLSSQLFIDYYLTNINKKAKTKMLTCTKNLQEQYINEFRYIFNLWGKSNYRCEQFDTDCAEGSIIHKQKGNSPCDMCPHKHAFQNWNDGLVGLSNFNTHVLYELFQHDVLSDRNLLIVDEAHLLEKVTADYVSFSLSKKNWEKFTGVKLSEKWELKVFSMNSVSEIINFLESEYLPKIIACSKEHENSKDKDKIKLSRELKSDQNTIEKIIDEYKENSCEYIAEKKIVTSEPVWEIQPVWISSLMRKYIWGDYDHVILMSATVVDVDLFCNVNGIEPEDVAYIKMKSPFPVKNRPIHYFPVGKMSYKEKANTWELYKPYIKKILKKYEGKKGIIHTGNFEIWQWLKDDIIDDRLVFVSPTDRQDQINYHFKTENDTVLVSPSLMTGIDLKDDYSRFQLILKMPYPSLGSLLNKTRVEQMSDWYIYATVTDLIQGYGRSIRSIDDYADTIILDSCFSDILARYSHYLPDYFIEAVKIRKV